MRESPINRRLKEHMSNLLELVSKLPIVSIDLEGDGHQPPGIVELSILRIEGLKLCDERTWLLNPGRPIKPFATKIHGIEDREVADSPLLSEVEGEIKKEISEAYLLAQNASVELSVLRRCFPDWEPLGVIDTLKLSRTLLPQLGSYKLGSLINYFDLESRIGEKTDSGPHRSYYDALAAFYVFLELLVEANVAGLPLKQVVVSTESGDGGPAPQLELF